MSLLRNLAVGLVATCGALLGAPHGAWALNSCVSLSPYPIVIAQPVDPFAGAANGSITLSNQAVVATRATTPVSGSTAKVQEADFLFWQPTGDTSAYTVQAVESQNRSVLYPANTPAVANNSQAQVVASFGGGSTNSVTFHLNMTIPYANVSVGTNTITFPMAYYCKLTGGGNTPDFSGNDPIALQLQFNVQSALQASFVGTALDFGEVGNVTNAQAASHTVSGQLRVASSGPYSVAVTTDNGYRMTYPGGSVANASQRIGYQVNFLGQTTSNSSPTFATRTCQAAGLSGSNLAISATLAEGGSGKTVAPNYRDNIQVTFTPLAIPPASTPQACS
jgi:hypothetical protein